MYLSKNNILRVVVNFRKVRKCFLIYSQKFLKLTNIIFTVEQADIQPPGIGEI